MKSIAAVWALAALAVPAAAQDAWKSFGDAQTGFTVDLPCQPGVAQGTMAAGEFEGPQAIYNCDLGEHGERGELLIAVADFSSTKADPDVLLDAVAAQALKATEGTLDRSEKIEVAGDSGREIIAHAGDTGFHARMILHGGKIYQTLGVGPTNPFPVDYDRVESSFKVLP